MNLNQEAKMFDKYNKAKKHFKVSTPDYTAIYDFDNLDGTFTSATCNAYYDLYEDAEENPENYI